MAGFLAARMRKVQEAIGTATVTEDPEDVKDVKAVRLSKPFCCLSNKT